jgi:tellurite resistance protein
MDFFEEVDLDRAQAEAIARGLFAVAKCDGLHEREAALIASFWLDSGGGADALSSLERGATIRPDELAAALPSPAQRQLFLKTAILLTYADGKVTAEERQCVREFASGLGIAEPAVEALEQSVKDFLLHHLAHLQNVDAAAAIAKKLEV